MKESVIWHYRRVNDIETNEIQYKYCLMTNGEYYRMFFIRPVYPVNEEFYTMEEAQDEESFNKAKYFVVFQTSGSNPKEGQISLPIDGTFANVFEDIDIAERFIVEFMVPHYFYPFGYIMNSRKEFDDFKGKYRFI